MPAYLIAEHVVTDAKKFDEYRTKALPMIEKHGAAATSRKAARTSFRRAGTGNRSGS